MLTSYIEQLLPPIKLCVKAYPLVRKYPMKKACQDTPRLESVVASPFVCYQSKINNGFSFLQESKV